MEQRPTPGTISVPGREFLYVQHADERSFAKLFDDIGVFIEKSVKPLPRGGFITTNAILTLPSGVSLFGLSFKGDLSGWEKGIVGFAEARNLLTAKIRGSSVVLGTGETSPLNACAVRYFDLEG
jgi:hypothetical protein